MGTLMSQLQVPLLRFPQCQGRRWLGAGTGPAPAMPWLRQDRVLPALPPGPGNGAELMAVPGLQRALVSGTWHARGHLQPVLRPVRSLPSLGTGGKNAQEWKIAGVRIKAPGKPKPVSPIRPLLLPCPYPAPCASCRAPLAFGTPWVAGAGWAGGAGAGWARGGGTQNGALTDAGGGLQQQRGVKARESTARRLHSTSCSSRWPLLPAPHLAVPPQPHQCFWLLMATLPSTLLAPQLLHPMAGARP